MGVPLNSSALAHPDGVLAGCAVLIDLFYDFVPAFIYSSRLECPAIPAPIAATELASPPRFAAKSVVFTAEHVTEAKLIASGTMTSVRSRPTGALCIAAPQPSPSVQQGFGAAESARVTGEAA